MSPSATVAAMSTRSRLTLICTSALLLPAAAAHAATTTVKLSVPASGKASALVARASGVRHVSISAPRGVIVTGGARGGRLAIAAALPTGHARAGGTVTVRLVGRSRPRVSGPLTVRDALLAPPAHSAAVCPSQPVLADVLSRGLRPRASQRALGHALAARLCGAQLDATTAAAIVKLGLRVPAAGGGGTPPPGGTTGTPPPGGTTGTPPPGGTTGTPPPGGGSKAPACSDGIDNDGDGQIDAIGQHGAHPDPGCSDGSDTSEDSESPLPPACRDALNIGTAGDDKSFIVGVNGSCGQVKSVFFDVDGAVTDCQALTVNDNSGTCQVTDGNAVVTLQKPADQTDVMGHLASSYTCASKTVVALTLADGSVIEGAPPKVFIGGQQCPDSGGGTGGSGTGGGGTGGGGGGGGGTTPPACSDGIDNDGDGQVDYAPTDTTVPDPGCSSPTDNSEDSEGQLSDAHCKVQTGFLDNDARKPAFYISDCAVTQMWLELPQPVTACTGFSLDANSNYFQSGSCANTGRTAVATAPDTRGNFGVGAEMANAYECGSTSTLVAVLDDGSAYEITGTFC
jgi:hypothetical protein